MTVLRTQQPDLPQMVSETLTHLREGYEFLAGEMSHAMALIDCGEPGLARAVLQEALRVMDRELCEALMRPFSLNQLVPWIILAMAIGAVVVAMVF